MDVDEQQEDIDRRTTTHEVGKLLNGLNLRITTDDDQSILRKRAKLVHDAEVTLYADVRAETCWTCRKIPTTWVREVVFDLGIGDGPPERKSALAVDGAHYIGPVPGFCTFCLATRARELAEVVYNNHEVIAWGFRPTRWFVIFTDGTMARGKAIEIDPLLTRAPIIKEHHDSGFIH